MERTIALNDGTSMLLRPYRPDDVERLHEAVRASIRELSPWMYWCHDGYSMEETRAWIEGRAEEWEHGISYDFTMIDGRSGALIGGCGLNAFSKVNRFANLGYWVRTGHTRRGAASAAVRAVAGFGLGELGLLRIEIVVATGNVASQRVAEKVGALREGVMRNRLVSRDEVHDAVMFSLIPP